MRTEYRVLQAAGAVVLFAGFMAVLVDSRFAAGVALSIGFGTYLIGLLGAWWNRGD